MFDRTARKYGSHGRSALVAVNSPIGTPKSDVRRGDEQQLRQLLGARENDLHVAESRLAAVRRAVGDQAPAMRLGLRGRLLLAETLSKALEQHARTTAGIRQTRYLLSQLQGRLGADHLAFDSATPVTAPRSSESQP